MAMLTCAECGNDASTSAKTCPHCGASRKAMRRKPREPMGKWSKYGLIAVCSMPFIIAALMAIQPKPVQTAEEKKADENEKNRLNMAMAAAGELKASLRDPDSLVFEKIIASEDGEATCIIYRARNGFGGMGRDMFIFTDQDSYTTSSAWRKHCTHRPMYDYTATLPMMMKM